MKFTMYLAISIALIFTACKKDDDHVADNTRLAKTPEQLAGKWKQVASYVSPGGQTEWQTVKDGPVWTFTVDSNFISNTSYNGYKLDLARYTGATGNDTLLYIYKKGVPESDTTLFAISKITPDSLTVWGINCIEGCGSRFVRVKN